MSRKIKLDQNNSRKRATINYAVNYASTPKNAFVQFHSISLSEIETASSSSGGRRNLQLQDAAKMHRKFTKEKKREDTKRRMKDSDSELEAKQKRIRNVKRKKKSDKKDGKRKRILEDTDSEWETELEKSIDELSIDLPGSIPNDDECIKLFEDPCTPEKTRDIPSNYEETLYTHESPIIGAFRKRVHLSKRPNNIILEDTLLPVNLPPTEVRDLEETDEDETIFDKSNAETHVPLRKSKGIAEQKSENDFSICLRRNHSVRTYPRKTIKFADYMQTFSRKKENIPIPPGMICDSGYCDKVVRIWKTKREESSFQKFFSEQKNTKRKTIISKRNTRKRKQKYDVYDAIDEIDNEFETDQNGKRISFREFCNKQKKTVEIISLSDTEEFICP